MLACVVYRLFPTSNHNSFKTRKYTYLLYIVYFLHQTTTISSSVLGLMRCISSISYIKPQLVMIMYLLWISCISSISYIKPQLSVLGYKMHKSCISSISYIKPQLIICGGLRSSVVYRLFPTSNHNDSISAAGALGLYIVYFLHQTTTIRMNLVFSSCCISSISYIKPQHVRWSSRPSRVVYRLFPTSNHNDRPITARAKSVVYRLFPTSNHNNPAGIFGRHRLYIVYFLHQTTTIIVMLQFLRGCISSISYIKPQPSGVL